MDDAEAHAILYLNFNEERGFIKLKDHEYMPTLMEWEAVDELVNEWDYCYVLEYPWENP